MLPLQHKNLTVYKKSIDIVSEIHRKTMIIQHQKNLRWLVN